MNVHDHNHIVRRTNIDSDEEGIHFHHLPSEGVNQGLGFGRGPGVRATLLMSTQSQGPDASPLLKGATFRTVQPGRQPCPLGPGSSLTKHSQCRE